MKYSSSVTWHMDFAQQGGQAGTKVLVGIYGVDKFPGRRNQMNGKKEVERAQEACAVVDMLRVSQHMLVSVPGCTVWSPWHTQTTI